ncbi:MAG: PhzF family phenazine biosynthesis protein [Alphaproteobacteria bacterium]|jgi:PhzF family phenazine biosynthesis protein|nr:PhzF family phenazine biosynthesis protein [Alphaproteobacteria bacterium]
MNGTLPIFQIDAFTDRVFGGNPAAVCPLDEWLDDAVMQDAAAENNLSETAFFVPRDDGDFDIRWFTPRAEIDLAGHPTLATAWLILNRLETDRSSVRFHTKIGDVLEITGQDDLLEMDFPARPPEPAQGVQDFAAALGDAPVEVLAARDGMAVFETEDQVRGLSPDMAKVAAFEYLGVIATAPGRDCDFVSRFFAPRHGIPEDPVTGSAHCTLIPFWAERLGKDTLHARQISARGGELFCKNAGARVKIAGRAALYMEGVFRTS